MKINFIVPAINIGGGLREVINLAQKMQDIGASSRIVTLWRATHQMSTCLPVKELTRIPAHRLWALLGFWYVFTCYAVFLIKSRKNSSRNEFFVFTHYLTVPFSLFVKNRQRLFFVQDLEWYFFGNGIISRIMKLVLIFCYRRGVVISANSYLTQELISSGVVVKHNLSIWANPEFKCNNFENEHRDFDFAMVLRRGVAKRLDLYLQFISLCSIKSGIKVAVITPHDEIASSIKDSVAQIFLRPSLEDMRTVYGRSKVFVMLSEHEGFGLPPLEAMGCACVPVCRASGGVRAYMYGDCLSDLVLPLNMPLNELFEFCTRLIANPSCLKRYSLAAVERFDKGVERVKSQHEVVENIILDMRNVLNSKN